MKQIKIFDLASSFFKRMLSLSFTILRKFWLLILIYLIFLIVFNWLIKNESRAIAIFNGWGLNQEFYCAWLPSFGEDLLFFGTIGLIGLFITTNILKYELFNIRLDSLANAQGISYMARQQLKANIKTLLSYTSSKRVLLVLKKISTDRKYIYAYLQFDDHVKNMCYDEKIPISLVAVLVSDEIVDNVCGVVNKHFIKNSAINFGDEVNSNKSHNESTDLEEISDWRTDFDETHFQNKDLLIIGEENNYDLNIKNDNGNYKYKSRNKFHIKENSLAHQRLSGQIWNRFNGDNENEKDWLFINNTCYTENFELTVKNNTNVDIRIDYKYVKRPYFKLDYFDSIDKDVKVYNNIILKPNGTKKIVRKLRFYKDDLFQLFLSNG